MPRVECHGACYFGALVLIGDTMRFHPMPLAIRARGFALLILCALYPALAFGLDQTYEGKLVPDIGPLQIPIVVEIHEFGTFLRGTVKTSPPVKGDAPIQSGGIVGSLCSVNVVLSKTISLRLRGTCEQKTYTGYYTLFDAQKKTATNGTFRLVSKVAEVAKADAPRGTVGTASSATACTKSNALCLSACPRDDSTAEALCANHCRTKLKTCKAQIKKPPAIAE